MKRQFSLIAVVIISTIALGALVVVGGIAGGLASSSICGHSSDVEPTFFSGDLNCFLNVTIIGLGVGFLVNAILTVLLLRRLKLKALAPSLLSGGLTFLSVFLTLNYWLMPYANLFNGFQDSGLFYLVLFMAPFALLYAICVYLAALLFNRQLSSLS